MRQRRFTSKTQTTDLLVVGCGVSGCAAALTAAELGKKVTVLTSAVNRNDSNSFWAQGGIIYKAPGDAAEDAKDLVKDVMTAGWNINKDTAVNLVARTGPQVVKDLLLSDLNHMPKIDFDRTGGGELALCKEGGHSTARIIHWKDHTGKAITEGMTQAIAEHENIELLEAHTAIDLVIAEFNGECVGATVKPAGEHPMTILANETFLATGGIGEIFLHTSNPPEARGDGIAIAARAGAEVSSLEYTQFHPTTLYIPGERRFLLTEALRGDGAILRDFNGRPFAAEYHAMADLAPRDVVSRMILNEMTKTGQPHMWLDISHLDSDYLIGRFPTIHAHCLARGLDFTKEAIPCVPAAHYSCGGLSVDEMGRTSIPRLRAIGEVACTGLHGANRLASTSLLEGIVFGKWAATDMVYQAGLKDYVRGDADSHKVWPEGVDYKEAPEEDIAAYWNFLQETMWTSFGPVRDVEDMPGAKVALDAISEQVERVFQESAWSPELFGLRNAFKAAACVAEAAIANKESIGCHFLSESKPAATISLGDMQEHPTKVSPTLHQLDVLHQEVSLDLELTELRTQIQTV